MTNNKLTSKEIYIVPEWMRPYLPLFGNTGGNAVEELLHDDSTAFFSNSVRYMLIVAARTQFELLTELHHMGLIGSDTDISEPVGLFTKCGDTWYETDATNGVPLYARHQLKEHQIRNLVNELRDIAIQYRDTQQLRDHIARSVCKAMSSSGLNKENNNG